MDATVEKNNDSNDAVHTIRIYLVTAYLHMIKLIHIPNILIDRIVKLTFCDDQILDLSNSITFEFGHYASYWDEDDIYYIKPKYKNLKEEVMTNTSGATLNINNWNQTLRKSKVILQSWIGNKLRAKNRPKWNRLLNIEPETRMPLKYLTALKIYTDFDLFHYNFGEYMKSKDISKKREFAHFTRLLIGAINLFGDDWCDHSISLYHGFNPSKDIQFNSVCPALFSELGFSSSKHVARTFATVNGTVITFDKCDCEGGVIFDVSAVSDYPEEKQWMTFGINCCITEYDSNGTKYRLQKAQIIEKLVSGSFLVDHNAQVHSIPFLF